MISYTDRVWAVPREGEHDLQQSNTLLFKSCGIILLVCSISARELHPVLENNSQVKLQSPEKRSKMDRDPENMMYNYMSEGSS